MSYPERTAWVELSAAVTSAVAYAVLWRLFGMGAAIAALSLMALPTLFLAPNRGSRMATRDERDIAIAQTASLAGYGVFWVAFVLATVGAWVGFQGAGSVPLSLLPLFPFGGWVVLSTARSVATLVLYARGR